MLLQTNNRLPSTQDGADKGASIQGKCKASGKVPGPEWHFVDNVRSFIDWPCKLCGVAKSRGEPRIREHFLGASNGCGNRINGG